MIHGTKPPAGGEPLAATLSFIQGLAERGFYGFITVKMEAGTPVHLRKEENFKPELLPSGSSTTTRPESNRRDNEQRAEHHRR